MNFKLKIFAILVFIILAALLVWFLLGGVETVGFEVRREDAVKGITVTGTVISTEDIDVTTEVTAKIEKLYVGTTQYVEKGQILATLDKDEPMSDVNAAQARLSQAQAQLRRSQVEYEDAVFDEERYEKLFEIGAVSKREVEERQLRTLTIAQQVQENRRQIEAAQAELAGARARLDNYVIKAPVSGYITRTYVSTGSVVSPQQPAYRLVAPENIYLSAEVEENEIDLIQPGQTALVIFDAYPDRLFTEKVYLMSRQVNPLTGTFEARVTKPVEEVQVLVGMTFDATIILAQIDDVVIIPADFVLEENNHTFVFKKQGEFAEKTGVATVNFDNNRVVVQKGLKQGDVILKRTDTGKLKDGIKIRFRGFVGQ